MWVKPKGDQEDHTAHPVKTRRNTQLTPRLMSNNKWLSLRMVCYAAVANWYNHHHFLLLLSTSRVSENLTKYFINMLWSSAEFGHNPRFKDEETEAQGVCHFAKPRGRESSSVPFLGVWAWLLHFPVSGRGVDLFYFSNPRFLIYKTKITVVAMVTELLWWDQYHVMQLTEISSWHIVSTQ